MGSLGKYIGLTYKNLGRDIKGVDCYGLIYLIFQNERNIELPDFTELKYEKEWYKSKNHILDNVDEKWDSVSLPYKKYDILLMRLGTKSIVNHCGMFLEGDKFIHIYEDHKSELGHLNGFWSDILYKAIRWKVN